MHQELQRIYPLTCSLLPEKLFISDPETLPEEIRKRAASSQYLPFLADIAEIERACSMLRVKQPSPPVENEQLSIHPGVILLAVEWRGLPQYILDQSTLPRREKSFVLITCTEHDPQPRISAPTPHDLLALKVVAEQLTIEQVAREGGTTSATIDSLLRAAIHKGLLVAPPSKIARPEEAVVARSLAPEFFSSPSFALQWHITQRCDLNCRHCYDRSTRTEMPLNKGIEILNQFTEFCRQHHVYGQVSFTGGNPFLHPHFFTLYQEAAERGLLTAILGNPVSDEMFERLVEITLPVMYQVSLEGLREHNDAIRGKGHFDRTLTFLDQLRERNIFSMVMLTLTRNNLDQVLPLAELLHGRTNLFTFNRLAMVGEGARLASVPVGDYIAFLERYLDTARDYNHMSLKDNLFNTVLDTRGQPLCGGCTGYGCGAAFNFLSLLPDGEVHACRKFPSPIGSIFETSLHDLYHSAGAEQYRQGSAGCKNCRLRPVCGGCPAVSHGFGQDIFSEIDPYCTISTQGQK